MEWAVLLYTYVNEVGGLLGSDGLFMHLWGDESSLSPFISFTKTSPLLLHDASATENERHIIP